MKYGWLPGARYTNLRDIKNFKKIGLIDIDWKNYNYKFHLKIVKKIKPFMTVARDVIDYTQLDQIIKEAKILEKYCSKIIIVPKDKVLKDYIDDILGLSNKFILGYSVPTKYGKTDIPIKYFKGPVHLLGGRPTFQKKLSKKLDVFSFDCNSFTIDAQFGKYFDGKKYVKLKNSKYDFCIENSIEGINKLWENYKSPKASVCIDRGDSS
jgi:hypothetical protein